MLHYALYMSTSMQLSFALMYRKCAILQVVNMAFSCIVCKGSHVNQQIMFDVLKLEMVR
jgi:hypothetical protein